MKILDKIILQPTNSLTRKLELSTKEVEFRSKPYILMLIFSYLKKYLFLKLFDNLQIIVMNPTM